MRNKRKTLPIIALVTLLAISVTVNAFAAQNNIKVEIKEPAPVTTNGKAPANNSEAQIKVVAPQKSSDIILENGIEDWMLTLVNASNPLPDGYLPKLKALSNGLQFDERAIGQLNAMLSDARQQGLNPVVCSAYRSIEKQQRLFNNQVAKQMAKGLDRERAEAEARRSVAMPGTSEHNLGLAVDIVSADYQLLDEKQADTPEMKWLIKHCSEYGFILRCPKGKEDITGITYEPWHFRYVGADAAREIMNNGLCLEEYLSDYMGGN